MNKKIKILVRNFIKTVKIKLSNEIISIFIFGSRVKNNYRKDSDLDILFITKHRNYKIREILSEIASEFSIESGIYISPIIESKETWTLNKKYQTAFYNEIIKYGNKYE